ncbi:hypothetical protein TNCV_3577871 [Trichonephila clavipes]|uniref:Uncharacterized protein n=1 Tax=Trichonephila clavipes TaxID=2585209 RepID=A0A8X6RG61_TRICX|nr:hypothetical protein TNCV_3577871 [Trichonephila clavipes]
MINAKKKERFLPNPGTIVLRQKDINLVTGKPFRIKTCCSSQMLINSLREDTEYLLDLGVKGMGQSNRTLPVVWIIEKCLICVFYYGLVLLNHFSSVLLDFFSNHQRIEQSLKEGKKGVRKKDKKEVGRGGRVESGRENGRKEKGGETEGEGTRGEDRRDGERKGLSPEIGEKKTMNAGGVENGI